MRRFPLGVVALASDAVEAFGPPAERDGSRTPAAPIGAEFSTGAPLIQNNPPR